MSFIVDRDPGDERPDHVHHPDCGGRGTARGDSWPLCCGSNSDIETFFDENFDDFFGDYNLAEAEDH